MKKNMFRAFALSALLFMGVSGAQAQQKTYDVPALDPEAKTMADQVISLNMEDPDAANKAFSKLVKKIGKSKEDLVAVGTYFLDNNNYPAAKQCADRVYELAPEYIPGLMFSGEVCMMRKDYGGAGQKFDAVLMVDSNNVAALKRNAFVYKNVNPYVAIEALDHILRLEPNNYGANKDLGDIHYKLDKYKEAVDFYEKYYAAVPKDTTSLDIRSCENFLQSLYSQANFGRITELTSELLPLAPKDMVIRRMDFFAKVNKIGEAIDYEGALKAAKDASAYLTSGEYADSTFLSLDYEYLAALAKEENDMPAAISAYEKALEKDPAKLANYKELAKVYARNKDNDKAIATYKQYMEKKGDQVDLTDYFGLGQEYVKAVHATTDPAKKSEYIAGGMEAYNKVLEKQPDYYKAVMQQAALNIKDSKVAEEAPKALYEKALGMMPEDENANSSRLLAAQYLAFYYSQKEDFDTCRKYVNIMLKADPESGAAKNFDSALKSMGK